MKALKKKNLVFLGAPGAGKGTVAKLVAETTGLVHISTGDIFRNEIKAGTELGKKAKEYVHNGNLVPDEIVAEMVTLRLSHEDCKKGFILDGFPRTLPQAELFKPLLKNIKMTLDCVVFFNIKQTILIKRLTARLVCKECGINFNKIFAPPKIKNVCDACGGKLYQRADDSLETAQDRLKVYTALTHPLIDYYKKHEHLLFEVDASQAKEISYKKVMKELI